MYKFQLIGLLVLLSLTQDTSTGFYLTPPLPPTTFFGQYYTVQFRVIGMTSPTFSFDNLPRCFSASANGTIQGTPNATGSFAVRVNFQSSEGFGSKDIVIRVAMPTNDNAQPDNQATTQQANKFMVISGTSSLTFWAGDQVQLSLKAINGQQPYAWNYINLPSQLSGNSSGAVFGVFEHEGYYTFSASACDRSGLTADAYFTLNIQPVAAIKGFPLVQVPNMVSIRYDLQQVYDQEIAATNALFQVLKNVHQIQNQTNKARDTLNKTNLLQDMAQQQANYTEIKLKTAMDAKKLAASTLTSVQNRLTNIQNKLALSKTKLVGAKILVDSQLTVTTETEDNANQLRNELALVSEAFINAQTESSQAAQLVKGTLSVDISVRNDYSLAFATLSNRKQSLQAAQAQSQFADMLVSNSKNSLSLVQKLNDDAQANLTRAEGVYEQTKIALDNANSMASLLKANLSEAADGLGSAEFNLHQAVSALYVAQARKQQADKSTELVRLQTSTQANELMFAGCDQQAYPTISGSATVTKMGINRLQLSTDRLLLYGSCTQGDISVKSGDLISYSGYLKQGIVQCAYFKKMQ